MKKNLILVIISSFFLSAFTSATGNDGDKVIKGFSGGMMVHTGYLSGSDNPYNYNPSGATFGIGGVAKVTSPTISVQVSRDTFLRWVSARTSRAEASTNCSGQEPWLTGTGKKGEADEG